MLRGKLSFEEMGIKKQEEAYKVSYAKRQFRYSCEKCCLQNKSRGDCKKCPIKDAHIDALTRIALEKRVKPERAKFTQYGASKFHNDKFHKVTIVVHFD